MTFELYLFVLARLRMNNLIQIELRYFYKCSKGENTYFIQHRNCICFYSVYFCKIVEDLVLSNFVAGITLFVVILMICKRLNCIVCI
jgi:hypothetical protein